MESHRFKCRAILRFCHPAPFSLIAHLLMLFVDASARLQYSPRCGRDHIRVEVRSLECFVVVFALNTIRILRYNTLELQLIKSLATKS
ncbi:hypothetical protein TNCV_4451881 [Trichonephila clavipes]|nr:hypothetical protein TNCV_4451881 [Trichonephila clavipes]